MAADNAGPLDISLDLSQTKTTIPMPQNNAMMRLRLKNLVQKGTEKGKVLTWEYEALEPFEASDGAVIKPGEFGSTFFEDIQLYAKPDAKNPRWFESKIATRVDALLGTGDPGNTKGKPARPVPTLSAEMVPQLLGKELVAKIRHKTGDYSGVEFADVYFPGDVAA